MGTRWFKNVMNHTQKWAVGNCVHLSGGTPMLSTKDPTMHSFRAELTTWLAQGRAHGRPRTRFDLLQEQ